MTLFDAIAIEAAAKGAFEAAHKNIKNVWPWDSEGLDVEHPTARKRYRRDAKAALAAAVASLRERQLLRDGHGYEFSITSEPPGWGAFTGKSREDYGYWNFKRNFPVAIIRATQGENSAMTDDEFLADVTQQNCYDLTREEFDRLVGLARIGAAVKPRPIEEAPRDRLILGAWFDEQWQRVTVYWDTDNFADGAWTDGSVKSWGFEEINDLSPTHFYDLSALPKPEGPKP